MMFRLLLISAALSAGLTGIAAGADMSARVEATGTAFQPLEDSVARDAEGGSYFGLSGNFRLNLEHDLGPGRLTFSYRAEAVSGGEAGALRVTEDLLGPAPPSTLLDLEGDLASDDGFILRHRIDRLGYSITQPVFVFRIGRQALTWGAGTVFHPADLVAPFAPNARDTEFKTGVDMVYLQVLIANGSDFEAVAVPRAATQGGSIDGDESTFALRYRGALGDLSTALMLARDRGDVTGVVGLSGDLGGLAWNAELVPTKLASGKVCTSGLLNVSGAFAVQSRSATWFAEYYRNGFGMDETGYTLAELPAYLSNRLARGQVFNTGRNYIALGGTLEMTPLLGLSGTAIHNLDDQSTLASLELNRSLSDNSNLIFGTQLPFGDDGTEFSGLYFDDDTGLRTAPDRSVYIQFRKYY